MAQPIVFQAPRTAPDPHADAVRSAYELLQLLHDRGVLELLRGVVGARDEIAEVLTSAANTPESIRAIRNFLLLTKFFAGIPPEVLQSLATAVSHGAAREKSHKAPSLWRLVGRLRNPNSRHAMAVTLDLMEAVGRGL
jgi:uncharacterized protein YjgD (DUF1641 family)